jgi:hypothetical protein
MKRQLRSVAHRMTQTNPFQFPRNRESVHKVLFCPKTDYIEVWRRQREDKEMLLQRQFEVYKECHGSSFKYYPCAEYLSDNQKWVGVIMKGNLTDTKTKNGGTNPKIERPIGKKRATKDK